MDRRKILLLSRRNSGFEELFRSEDPSVRKYVWLRRCRYRLGVPQLPLESVLSFSPSILADFVPDGNEISDADSQNLLLFLQALRTSLGVNPILSMAASMSGLIGPAQAPVGNVAPYAQYLEYVLNLLVLRELQTDNSRQLPQPHDVRRNG